MQDLASFLKVYMSKQGLSLREMEQHAQVSRSLLNNLINGKDAEPKLSTLKGIAQAVGLPLWRVIEMAGVDLDLPDEISYDAQRLVLEAQQNSIIESILKLISRANPVELFTVSNYLMDAQSEHLIYQVRISFIEEQHNLITDELMKLAPTFLANTPPNRANVYEGRRMPRNTESITGTKVTVNGKNLLDLVSEVPFIDWGYAGLGSRYLAEAIMLYEYGSEFKDEYGELFFQTVTKALPQGNELQGFLWTLESQQLDIWLLLIQLIHQAKAQHE